MLECRGVLSAQLKCRSEAVRNKASNTYELATDRKSATSTADSKNSKMLIAGRVFSTEGMNYINSNSNKFIPRLKLRTRLMRKKPVAEKGDVRSKPVNKAKPLSFAETMMMSSSEPVLPIIEYSVHREEAKKARWYDCRPRLMINRYYRKNYVLKFNEQRHRRIMESESYCRPAVKSRLEKPLSMLVASPAASQKLVRNSTEGKLVLSSNLIKRLNR
eukprot:TRINITY_DN2109_c0_g1_i3.p1 TRINITY_DN2109_c0_g1~~TRINITY_DN2109_c0_g1_i3.p1  ORF type:complete len:217 (-),score=35.84 TRINITY_DN2109_c0_g1_i3:99-749(-)